MAKRTRIVTEDLQAHELVALLKTYWANQPNGFQIGHNKLFDANEIRRGLQKLGNISDISDDEIIQAHRALLGIWLSEHSNPGAPANSAIDLRIEWAGMDDPDKFKIIFLAQVITEAERRNAVPVRP